MPVEKTRLDPRQLFGRLAAERQVCFLTGAGPDAWETVIGFNPAEVFTATAGGTEALRAFVERSIKKRRKLIGYISYDLGCRLHEVPLRARDDLRLPDIFFCAFDNYIRFSGCRAWLHYTDRSFPGLVAAISRRTPRPVPQAAAGRFAPERTREQYARAFRKIKRAIYNGDIYQINLSHRLRAETQLPARALFANIMEKNPVGFLAYIEGDGYELLSASPERFVKTENRCIWTCPIKGTRPRGRTRASDARYCAALARSPKEAAELNMITDLLRNDLGRVCRIGSVRVAGSRLVRKCPAVWHTYALVTGSILPELTPLDALLSMLPGGSITGCPKKRAIEIIDELEPTARSVYTGVIGSINPDRDLDFSVAIRTIIKKGGKLYLQVGGGIVHASDEQEEYRETLAKARSLMHIF